MHRSDSHQRWEHIQASEHCATATDNSMLSKIEQAGYGNLAGSPTDVLMEAAEEFLLFHML